MVVDSRIPANAVMGMSSRRVLATESRPLAESRRRGKAMNMAPERAPERSRQWSQ